MQFQLLRNLFILFVIISSVGANQAFAQKIKVKKTRGNQSVIESSVPLEEGQVYDLASDSISQNVDYKSTGLRSRQNSFSIGGSIYSLRGDEYQRNSIALQGRYGWNFSMLEFGPVLAFTSEDLGAGATSEVTAGGYFDYNLIPNRDTKSLVYGVIGLISFGSRQFPAASGGGSATTLDLNAGAFVSWFINSSSLAVRAEGFFDYQQISTTLKQTNVTGFGSRALMVFYF